MTIKQQLFLLVRATQNLYSYQFSKQNNILLLLHPSMPLHFRTVVNTVKKKDYHEKWNNKFWNTWVIYKLFKKQFPLNPCILTILKIIVNAFFKNFSFVNGKSLCIFWNSYIPHSRISGLLVGNENSHEYNKNSNNHHHHYHQHYLK